MKIIRFLVLALISTVACGGLPAQTILPVVSEYLENADGSFQIRNDSLAPFTVILEPRSFTVNAKGDPMYRPLDPEITVQLSAKSFRVLPHRSYAVFYRARSRQLPAWFTIYANILGKPGAPGIQLVVRLPHTVYLLTKSSLSRSGISVSRGEFDPLAHTVRFSVENHAAEFDRAQSIELRSPSGKQTYPGFPIYPGQRRVVSIPWQSDLPPVLLSLTFSKFRWDSPFPSPASSP